MIHPIKKIQKSTLENYTFLFFNGNFNLNYLLFFFPFFEISLCCVKVGHGQLSWRWWSHGGPTLQRFGSSKHFIFASNVPRVASWIDPCGLVAHCKPSETYTCHKSVGPRPARARRVAPKTINKLLPVPTAHRISRALY